MKNTNSLGKTLKALTIATPLLLGAPTDVQAASTPLNQFLSTSGVTVVEEVTATDLSDQTLELFTITDFANEDHNGCCDCGCTSNSGCS